MNAKLMALIGSAEEGSEKAQLDLSLVYLHGEGVPLNAFNTGEAARLLELAIAKGNVIAPHIYNTYLGEGYQYPRKSVSDAKEAVQAVLGEVKNGNTRLLNLLGHFFQHGLGVEKKLSEAVRLYKYSSDQGNPVAHRNLGACYFGAIGVDRNVSEALRLFRLAVEQGECGALTALGHCYQHGLVGDLPRNLPEAHRLYKLAAEQGFKMAQNNLAYCCQHGLGCERNASIALRLYRLASQHGCPAAHFNLGMCHYDGVDGYIEKNLAEAARFFEMASILGHAAGQNSLAHCYRHGLGVERNLSEALRLYRLSAEQGYVGGLVNLAFCYRMGLLGVKKSLTEARRLYQLASEQGDEAATSAVKQLDVELKERESAAQGVSVSTSSSLRLSSLSIPDEATGARSKSPSPVHSAPLSPVTSSGLLSPNSALRQSASTPSTPSHSALHSPVEQSEDESFRPDAKREHAVFAVSSGGDRSAARLGLVEKEERYQLKDRLGYGSVASVYSGVAMRGKNKSSVFAVKVMQQYHQSYFMNELATLKQLSHPNIAPVYEAFLSMMDNAEYLFLVMDKCDSDVQKYLDTEYQKILPALNRDALTARSILVKDWTLQLLNGIQYMHQNNIIHRDIKPSNILIRVEKGKHQLKLADAGEAKFRVKTKNYMSASLYEAPELWNPLTCGFRPDTNSTYTNAVDIWSLGIVVLQLALLYDMESLGAFLWECKLLDGAMEKRKARVDTFVASHVQPKISADFFGANQPIATQFGGLLAEMLCQQRSSASLLLELDFVKKWRKETDKVKPEKNPKPMERWNLRKSTLLQQINQIPDFIYYRDEESLAALGLMFGDKIGAGTSGVVFKAALKHDYSQYALKKLVCWDPLDCAQFNDIVMQKSFSYHQNIVQVYDIYLDSHEVVNVLMEYCELDFERVFDNIAEFFQDNHISEQNSFEVRCYWMIQLLEALNLIHSHFVEFVHCDIRPSNVLLMRSADQYIPKIGDFGSSRHSISMAFKGKSMLACINSHRAPELWTPTNGLAEKNYTTQADIWSLGMIFMQLWFDITTKDLLENYLPLLGGHYDQFNQLMAKLLKEKSAQAHGDLRFGSVCEIFQHMVAPEELRSPADKLLTQLHTACAAQFPGLKARANEDRKRTNGHIQTSAKFLRTAQSNDMKVSVFRLSELKLYSSPNAAATAFSLEPTLVLRVRLASGPVQHLSDKRKSLTPSWFESFPFKASKSETVLQVALVTEKGLVLGEAAIDLTRINYETKGLKWFPLRNGESEEICQILLQIE